MREYLASQGKAEPRSIDMKDPCGIFTGPVERKPTLIASQVCNGRQVFKAPSRKFLQSWNRVIPGTLTNEERMSIIEEINREREEKWKAQEEKEGLLAQPLQFNKLMHELRTHKFAVPQKKPKRNNRRKGKRRNKNHTMHKRSISLPQVIDESMTDEMHAHIKSWRIDDVYNVIDNDTE